MDEVGLRVVVVVVEGDIEGDLEVSGGVGGDVVVVETAISVVQMGSRSLR